MTVLPVVMVTRRNAAINRWKCSAPYFVPLNTRRKRKNTKWFLKDFQFCEQITFPFLVQRPHLASYRPSPSFLPYPVFISATFHSSLYIRHHNNHKCSDRFSGTAVRGEASEGESESVRERKRQSHPPTQKPSINKCTQCSSIEKEVEFPTAFLFWERHKRH